MVFLRNACRLLTLLPAAVILSACGGGGSGGAATPTPSPPAQSPPPTAWVKGQFAPESSFVAMCVAPRTGTDPGTNKPYPDTQGTLLDELNWLRSWTNDLYLWFDEVPDQDPATFTSDATYFTALKTSATTASGNPKDKFHFTYPTATWEALSQSGVQAGYGANFVVISGTPPRNVVVSYTEPNSGAATAPANLARGAKLLTIDGVDLVNANDQASVDTLNAGLSPKTVGESHTFSILDAGATTPRTVTLVSADVTVTPVQNVRTLTAPNGSLVGYMLFNDHLATAEGELVAAFSQMQSAGAHDLVLDIRYNGGGYLDIASEVAFMIAGPSATAGQTFELSQFNSKHPTINPVTGAALTPLGFHATTQGFSTTAGQALPALNLTRVFVLTTASTCSASESIINSLRGVNVQVIQIGSTTCGKPYGFYPPDNCGVTYFSIQFQGINAQGFGNYPDGFTPQNTLTTQGVLLPGCSVADDFSHALGDSSEGLLASALSYQSNGTCPVAPSGVVGPPVVSGAYIPPAANGLSVKSLWQQ
ncbi:MAG TPA: S41 family peptidase, partial [Steroidobacteraceae bacterium]